MEATCSSKLSVDFQRATRYYNTSDSNILVLHLRSEPLDNVHASDEFGTGQNTGWYVCSFIIQNI
jgi:hypothetical protein